MHRPTALRSPLTAGAVALALALSACGSSADEADTDATDAPTTVAGGDTTAETTGESAATTATAAETSEATDATDAEAEAPAGGQAVSLAEWEVVVDGAVAAGETTFAITNDGENPHALAVAVGDAYENLPLKDNGAVDTDALGADFIGTSDNVAAGATGALTVTLEAGSYVFFCPIEFGPNSHAKAGQVLSVTVA